MASSNCYELLCCNLSVFVIFICIVNVFCWAFMPGT